MTLKLTKHFILFILLSYSLNAQLYKTHKWDEKPSFYQLSEQESSLASIAIKEKYLIQYFKQPLVNYIRLFETKHSIIRVNSEKGIKTHNRVYIPMRGVQKLINIKARVLTEDGKIINLTKSNIKELDNVEGYGSYKIFALEGVVKNSQVEFIYTVENKLSSVGAIVVQKDYDVKEAEVIIRKPASLKCDIQPYNGFPRFSETIVEGNRKAFTAVALDVPAMIDEKSAAPDANRMKIAYVVRPKMSNDMWQGLKTSLVNNYVYAKSRKLKGFIEEFEVYQEQQTDNTNFINQMASFIHSRINLVKGSQQDLNSLNAILVSKQASHQGVVKVFTALLNHYNVDYQLVLSSNRFRHRFDRHFYSAFNLQELLLYFPEEDKFLVPSNENSRLDYAPSSYISNDAVFITSEDYDFAPLNVPSSEHTKTIRDFTLSINEDLEAVVTCKQQLTGYKAKMVRGAYKYFKKEDINRFKSIFATSGIEDVNYSDFEISNEALHFITDNTPLEMNWTYTAPSLVEEVGNDIIFNVGKVIGTQAEFYQEEKRVNPVELDFPNIYNYYFEIEIPEGYTVAGLEEFNIDKKVIPDNSMGCFFTSTTAIKDNKIVIKVTEQYDDLNMELSYYEGYKDVVNAAFDFSQLSLIFEKQTTTELNR